METIAPTFRRWPDRVLIGLFVAFLLLPLMDITFHIDPTSAQSENRVLTAFPQSPGNFGDLETFLPDLELYWGDHFGCRRVLIMWHNKLKWSLFKDKNVRNVLVGTDGWMFMSDKRMVEHFRGALTLSEKELNNWQKLLEHRRDWLGERGIKYVFVLAPDKQSIYPEYVPTWLKNLRGQTKADQFFAHMKAHSTVEVLDLRPPLLVGKKFNPVYQKTDTHWNEFGAFIAYENLFDVLKEKQMPELLRLTLNSFNYTNRLAPRGDLAQSLGISLPEGNAFSFTPKEGLPTLEIFVPTGEHVKDMAFAKNPRGHDLAMVYHDSFGRYWVPFLGYSFGETDFFWRYNLDGPLIEQKKPVVVVNEMLERFFNVTDPNDLSTSDALH